VTVSDILLAGFFAFLAVLYVGVLVAVLTRRSRRASVKAFRLFFASFLLLVIAFPLVLAFPPAVVALPLVPLAAFFLTSEGFWAGLTLPARCRLGDAAACEELRRRMEALKRLEGGGGGP
jgi:hypothetical protein